ncbi:hypothetical protein RUM44_010806 [Polyplax serrata]|uniref:Ionotropic glutamate receptor C-terminal domain-containing protein n=1 Tax=Polyplax serrata TaxID=468196 RepID=A0ABR1AN82_POLSC
MTTRHGEIVASPVNPFDKSYNRVQYTFDTSIIELLCSAMGLNMTVLKTPLVSNIDAYKENPDYWILEQITNGTAEISATTLILSNKSLNICDYSFAIDTFRPQLYYRARSLRDDHNIYWAPFTFNAWISIIVISLLITITLIFILSRETKLPHQISYDVFARIIDIQEDREGDWNDNLPSTTEESLHQREKWEMGEIILVGLGAICQQGSARDPSTHAARILLLALFMLAVVSYTAYSASIISFISLFPSSEREQIIDLKNFSKRYHTILHDADHIEGELKLYFDNVEKTSSHKGFNEALKGQVLFVGDRDFSLTFLHQQNYESDLKCKLGRGFFGLEYHRVIAIKKESNVKKIHHIITKPIKVGLSKLLLLHKK